QEVLVRWQISECQPLVHDQLAEFARECTCALLVGLRIEHPEQRRRQPRDSSRLKNHRITPRWQFAYFQTPFSLIDCGECPFLDSQMVDRPMGRCAPAGGLTGLSCEAESCIGPFLMGEKSRTRRNTDRCKCRRDDPSCAKVFHPALPD